MFKYRKRYSLSVCVGMFLGNPSLERRPCHWRDIMGKKELEDAIGKQKSINASLTQKIALLEKEKEGLLNHLSNMNQQMKGMAEHKSLMIVNVNVTGADDVSELLNKSADLMKERLKELGLDERYNILTVPHTLSVGIVR